MKENAAKILIVGSECVPFAKTGGLADVIGTLPPWLKKMGYDVRVMLPLHRQIKDAYGPQMKHLVNFYIHLGWRTQYVGVEELELEGITYYFIDNEFYFGGPIYKGGEAEGEQYAYFCRAILEALPQIDFIPDILHANDWQTAVIPMLIKTQYANAPQGRMKTVLTLHNLIYQGKFHFGFIQDLLGIPDRYYTYQYMESYGCANLLKAGIVFADKLNTVSPTYAEEIKNPYFAEGLDQALVCRQDDLEGILNGIDVEEFNPETDPHIAETYSCKNLAGKKADKKALMEAMGLSVGEDTPIIGMVSRLTAQKGLDLVECILDEFMQDDVGLVVLGSGEGRYEHFFREAAYRYCGKVAVRTEYNNALAHQIYAGADFFLMPSRFEPCGISQMIALRYGTLPIVRETGGLADTVQPYNEYTGEGNGFTFTNFNAHDMLHVLRLACSVYHKQEAFRRLIKNAMQEDNSFAASAKEYAKMYESLLGR